MFALLELHMSHNWERRHTYLGQNNNKTHLSVEMNLNNDTKKREKKKNKQTKAEKKISVSFVLLKRNSLVKSVLLVCRVLILKHKIVQQCEKIIKVFSLKAILQ